jgi:hypothetical protein
VEFECQEIFLSTLSAFENFTKLYVRGSAAALNENESHYRPPIQQAGLAVKHFL